MSKYYYHGVDDLTTLIKILEDGEIKSSRLLGKTIEDDIAVLGLNGLDHICLCNKLESYNSVFGKSSFEQFIIDTFCFIISDEIEAEKTKTIGKMDYCDYILFKKDAYRNIEHGIHVSFFADEYRVKDQVSVDKVIGIGIPFGVLYHQDLIELRQVIAIAQAFGLDIVDSSDEDFVEKYELDKYNKEEIVQKIKGLGL